jgi:lipopolysaccharide biosynthesis protein
VNVVIAHFDADNRFSNNFFKIINCLQNLNLSVTVITTSDHISNVNLLPRDVDLRVRPNFGYDFYSYKIFLTESIAQGPSEGVLLLNSSFLLTDEVAFTKTLFELVEEMISVDFVGVVSSNQFSQHFQSFMLGIGPNLLMADWFRDWVNSIETTDTKQEVIHHYEIGLSQLVRAHGHSTRTLFNLTFREKVLVKMRYFKYILRCHPHLVLSSLRKLDQFNPSQFSYDYLMERVGIVKSEVVFRNPLNIKSTHINQLRRNFQLEVKKENTHFDRAWNRDNVKEALWISSGRARVAVHLHLHYRSLIPELVDYLRRIPEPFDLFLSTSREGLVRVALDSFYEVSNTVHIFHGPNMGRDIAPFLYLYQKGLFDPYDVCLKIHGKKSSYSTQGDNWRKAILSELLRDTNSTAQILEKFRANKIGLICNSGDYVTDPRHWGSNFSLVNNLLLTLGIPVQKLEDINFVAGSMFWFNPRSLTQLNDLQLLNYGFENEPIREDGSLAHAFERIFTIIVKHNQYGVTLLGEAESNLNYSDFLGRSTN